MEKSKTKFLQRLSREEKEELAVSVGLPRTDCVFVSSLDDKELKVESVYRRQWNSYTSSVIMDDFDVLYLYQNHWYGTDKEITPENERALYSYMKNKFGKEYIEEAKLAIAKKYERRFADLKVQMNEDLASLTGTKEKSDQGREVK